MNVEKYSDKKLKHCSEWSDFEKDIWVGRRQKNKERKKCGHEGERGSLHPTGQDIKTNQHQN